MVDPDWIFEQRMRQIFEKPGHLWTAAEQQLVIEWILDRSRLRLLLASVFNRFVAIGFSLDDIEDAWSEFCLNDLKSVMKTYNPTRSDAVPFREWLKFCFRRSCVRRLPRIRGKERDSTDDLTDESLLALQNLAEARMLTSGQSRDRGPLKNLETKELRNRITNCISSMTPLYRRVLVLKDVEEQSIAEIAAAMGKTDGYVKGTLFRARRQFRQLFLGEENKR